MSNLILLVAIVLLGGFFKKRKLFDKAVLRSFFGILVVLYLFNLNNLLNIQDVEAVINFPKSTYQTLLNASNTEPDVSCRVIKDSKDCLIIVEANKPTKVEAGVADKGKHFTNMEVVLGPFDSLYKKKRIQYEIGGNEKGYYYYATKDPESNPVIIKRNNIKIDMSEKCKYEKSDLSENIPNLLLLISRWDLDNKYAGNIKTLSIIGVCILVLALVVAQPSFLRKLYEVQSDPFSIDTGKRDSVTSSDSKKMVIENGREQQ